MKQYLLFDLDGTLTDPKVGITTCVQYALDSMGIQEPDLDKLECFIGPPLKNSFMEFYGFSDEQAEAAIAKYRERFNNIGLFENEVYKGVPKMLKTLKKKGFHLAVASSKPTVFVERILEHFHIAQYFEAVVGSELDGTRVDKDEVIQEALHRLFQGGQVDLEKIYMIGDRKFDAEGARKMGIESVGVAYGYGDLEELMEAHADYIVQSVPELQEFLLREVEYREPIKTPAQNLLQALYAFLLFFVVRILSLYALTALLQQLNGGGALTKNMQLIVTALSFLVATMVIWPMAGKLITVAAKDMRLTHLFREFLQNYILLGVVALGLQMGLTMLLTLLGLTQSGDYQAVAESQFGGNLVLGLICYGLVTPFAEECLFRGIIYNDLKKALGRKWAWGLSAALFGLYHGNVVQGIYGFVMGLLLAYGYEYFGSFKVPVVLHMLANILAYLLSVWDGGNTLIPNWYACVVLLICSMVALLILKKQKKVMK